jgi:serine/threonine-protein kinase
MTPQSSIGPYRIVSKLGAGGMGEVYRARDSKLARDVAIKVLPPALAGDAQYMARFEREAQTLAALSHPNIAAIYGIEQGAIVMELVEGDTLAERIARGPVPLDEALPIARQIAEGLEAAHERGIVHRDLKPANVKITPSGLVKLLDFGLAKTAGEASAATSATISPTLSLAMTQVGMILGTAAYMAPEQARGKPVDKRADIWAYGVVLYEMLTGRQLFGGETVTDTLASVVKDAPDLGVLPAETPWTIRRLVDRCLRKDPGKRMRDIGEARLAIDEPVVVVPAPVEVAPAKARLPWLPWVLAVVSIAAAGLGWWRAARPVPPRPLLRISAELPPDLTLSSSGGSMLALSPDGQRMAVAARGADGRTQLYTRTMRQAQFTALRGTENAHSPFFSPDGQWIAFAAEGKLKKISSEGGAALTLCPVTTLRGGAWADNGFIVFSPGLDGGLLRVAAAGGVASELTKRKEKERTHRWPEVLPGGEVVFTASAGATNYDDADIDIFSPGTGARKTLHRGGYGARYLTTPDGAGWLAFVRAGTLFAAPFDAKALALTGPPVPVQEDVGNSGSTGASFAVSRAGDLVYLPADGQGGNAQIYWADAAGRLSPLHGAPGTYVTPRISPDGKRLAFSTATDLWVKDLDRDTASRLTFLPGVNNWPVWTPDGRHIVFKSSNGDRPGLYWIRSDGAAEPQRLTQGQGDEIPYSISPDGKRLAFNRRASGASFGDVFTAAIDATGPQVKLGAPEVFVGAPDYGEIYPAFSPDGQWIAYMSLESGTSEIFVRPFPGPGGRWQVSASGGSYPVWSRNGRELFFKSADERVMVVQYSAGAGAFSAGRPRAWSERTVSLLGGLSMWDVAPDGKRIATILSDADEKRRPATHVTFLLNFGDELQRLGRAVPR